MSERGPKKPVISQAVDKAMETKSANEYALLHWKRSMADGVITIDEALEGVALQEKAFRDAQAVVPLAEKACQLAVIGHQYALYGDVTATAAANARTIGVEAPSLADAAYD